MRTRLVLEADDYERYVVARYFTAASTKHGRKPTRATRAQVKRFASAAFKMFVAERATALFGRERATAARLRGDSPPFDVPPLERPREQQPFLL